MVHLIPLRRCLLFILLLVSLGIFAKYTASSPVASANPLASPWPTTTSYVVVTFEVFGIRYYHYRDFDTSNLNTPEAQRYLKTVIRYDNQALRNRNVSNDDILILQWWGFASGGEAANFACNLERQGFSVWSNSACYSMPAQPTTPIAPPQPAPPATPVRPIGPEQPVDPGYPNYPASIAGRIIKTPLSPAANESVRLQVEASDSSDRYAALSYNWVIDGKLIVQSNGYEAYDAPTLDWTFPTTGSHSIAVVVTNRNTGTTTQIKESIGIIEPGWQSGRERESSGEIIDSQPSLNPVVVAAVGIVVGLLGITIILGLLKSLFFRVAK